MGSMCPGPYLPLLPTRRRDWVNQLDRWFESNRLDRWLESNRLDRSMGSSPIR